MKTRQLLRKSFDEISRSLREYLNPDNRRRLLEILGEEYIEKSENVLKFTRYAETMVYPQFRDKLLRIAKEEQECIRWLAEQITASGGKVPQTSYFPRLGKNAWDRLLTVLDKKKRHGSDRIQRLLQL